MRGVLVVVARMTTMKELYLTPFLYYSITYTYSVTHVCSAALCQDKVAKSKLLQSTAGPSMMAVLRGGRLQVARIYNSSKQISYVIFLDLDT